MNKGVLIVETDTAGSLVIDGSVYSQLIPAKVAQITLAAGQHILELRAVDNRSLWKEVVSVPAKEQVVRQLLLKGGPPPGQVPPPQGSPRTDLDAKFDELCYFGRLKEALAISPGGHHCASNDSDAVARAESEVSRCSAYSLDNPLGEPGTLAYAKAYTNRVNKVLETKCLNLGGLLYTLGRHLDALRYVNLESFGGDYREAKILPLDFSQSSGNSGNWLLRAEIKHALGDETGALDDLAQAEGWYNLSVSERQQAFLLPSPALLKLTPELASSFASVDADQRGRLHLSRAIVLRGLGRYCGARTELAAAAGSSWGNPYDQLLIERVRAELSLLPTACVEEPSISDQIDQVAHSNRFSALPQAQASRSGSSGAPPTLVIQNHTQFDLSILMDGPTSRSISVPAGDTLPAAEILPGSYRVLGRANAPNVLPFLGTQQYSGGSAYTLSFSVGPQR